MPSGIEEMTVKDWRAYQQQEEQYAQEWAKDRKLKRCKCGSLYTYLPDAEDDPGACPGCRGLK